MTILTIDEAAEFLRMTRSQLYTLTRSRSVSRMGDHAIPVLRINSNIRFCKESLIQWLTKLEQAGDDQSL